MPIKENAPAPFPWHVTEAGYSLTIAWNSTPLRGPFQAIVGQSEISNTMKE